ncbi:heterokaryon incompatibility protein-domain-containing protein [Podospora conica]|nr:heterokaryon incompatibility protein-domain-containing protein [Schizothecium conicum]
MGNSLTTLYSPLDPSKREIRLLHLSKHPRRGNLDKYRLSVFAFEDAPPFFALSYVWGSSEERTEIGVEGIPVPVTTNLAAALDHVWNAPGCEYLWVDAICINQSDTDEKNHQVPLMRHIYGRSARVLIWLGDASATSDLAMDFLRHWAHAIRTALDELHRAGNPINLANHVRQIAWTRTEQSKEGPVACIRDMKTVFAQLPEPFAARAFDDSPWKAADALFQRSYWRRVWVVQEVVLANAGTIMCGAKTLDLDDLIIIFPMFLIMMVQFIFMVFENIRFMTRENFTNRTFHLADLLDETASQQATDERDRVFALLGLVPNELTSITPNYSRSAQQVFTDVVIDHLSRAEHLYIVAGVGENAATRLPGLPSWVPDFSINSRHGIKESWSMYGGQDKTTLSLGASGTATARFTVVRMPPDQCLLRIRGFVCDQVAALSDAFQRDRCPFCQVRLSVEDMASYTTRDQSSILGTGVPWLFTLFRSLTVNVAPGRNEPDRLGRLALGFLLLLGLAMDPGEHAWVCKWGDFFASSESREAASARVQALITRARTTHPHLRPPIAFLARYLEINGASTETKLTEEAILAKFCGVGYTRPRVPRDDFSDADYADLFQGFFLAILNLADKTLVLTQGERMGFAQPGLQVGDVICIILGCSVPVVARRVEEDRLLMIGPARICGMEQGEMMKKLEEGAFEEQDLVFV